MPETVEKINNSILYGCDKLTKIDIPNSVQEISSYAFSTAQNLTDIIIHKSAGSIQGSPWGATKGEKAIKWVGE